ncbi:MAG: xanthine phosphoribosyltransferase [Alphaproteobacteria bacterium]
MSDSAAPQFFSVSWDTLHRDCRALVWRLLEDERSKKGLWKGLIAVTRGGLVPAAIVARELDIRHIETVCISSYSDDKQLRGLDVIKEAKNAGDGEGWLIIDDLVDTGTTAKAIREMLPKAHFATVYAKQAGKPLVDTFITEVSQNTWILFPWDTELKDSKPMVDQVRT